MVSKTQPAIPPLSTVHLETIYEESGSSLSSSIVDVQHQLYNRQQASTANANQTIQGLISARSIPSVDVHRRNQLNEHQQKLPIEVRYRDGTKRYIHPSLTTTPMVVNRRKYSHSSRHDSSSPSSSTTKINSKYRQIFNTTPKKKKNKLPKKSELVLTIITAEDLSQAGITPPSTSSPDESDTLAFTKSPSNSSLDTINTVKDVSLKDTDQVPKEQLQVATVLPSVQTAQPVIDISISNLRFLAPPRHHSQHQPQLRHPQQIATIRSLSLPSSQSHYLPPVQQKSLMHQAPPVAVVPPSPKKTLPSLQITLTSDENERSLSSKVKLPTTTNSISKSIIETKNSEIKQNFQPSASVLVGGGSRSAFRPFLKSTILNPPMQIPLNINLKPQIPTNQYIQNSSQKQMILPPHSHLQQYQGAPPSSSSLNISRSKLQPTSTMNSITYDHRSISSDTLKQSINSIIKNQIVSDKETNSNIKKNFNYSQQSIPIMTTKIIDDSLNKITKTKNSNQDNKNYSITVDPNLQWHSVTSKSLYDVPRLSNKYSDIPLHITIPEGTPTHNQKLLQKHDIALEKRLLDAGLSPETIALYERILEVADIREMGIISPPGIIDQYSHKSLL